MPLKQIQPLDTILNKINPATEESILLLRRITKLLESNSCVDSTGRQRFIFDTLDTSSGNVGADGLSLVLCGGMANITFGPAANTNNPAYDSRYYLIDTARYTYNSEIRSRLQWK